MTKTAYWILGIGIAIFAILVGAVLLVNKKAPATNQPAPSQGATSGTLYPVSVTVAPSATPQGATTTATIEVNDFLKDPQTKADPSNPGHYYLGNYIDPTVDSAPNVPYVIEYIEKTQYFSIALLREPIGSARQAAEQYLQQHLGISQSQMCQLHYMVSTPAWVNGKYANTSLGFSFCPGAVQLPL